MFFVTSAHPLHGTSLVAVCVARYNVVVGLRSQGLKVLRVVVHVGEGVGLALERLSLVCGLSASLGWGTDVAMLRLSTAAMMVEKYMTGECVVLDYCAIGLVVCYVRSVLE